MKKSNNLHISLVPIMRFLNSKILMGQLSTIAHLYTNKNIAISCDQFSYKQLCHERFRPENKVLHLMLYYDLKLY